MKNPTQKQVDAAVEAISYEIPFAELKKVTHGDVEAQAAFDDKVRAALATEGFDVEGLVLR